MSEKLTCNVATEQLSADNDYKPTVATTTYTPDCVRWTLAATVSSCCTVAAATTTRDALQQQQQQQQRLMEPNSRLLHFHLTFRVLCSVSASFVFSHSETKQELGPGAAFDATLCVLFFIFMFSASVYSGE